MLDDTHDEGEETLTLRLLSVSGTMVVDGEATGTIENRGQMPRALSARFGRTAAVYVVEHVEERLTVTWTPGIEGRFAGMDLPPGMQPDAAPSLLSGLAGGHQGGAGGGGPVSGLPGVAGSAAGDAGARRRGCGHG